MHLLGLGGEVTETQPAGGQTRYNFVGEPAGWGRKAGLDPGTRVEAGWKKPRRTGKWVGPSGVVGNLLGERVRNIQRESNATQLWAAQSWRLRAIASAGDPDISLWDSWFI